MKKAIPLSVEDFKKLKDMNYYYVDKTNLIKELLDKKGDVNLFLRPRRFGKTLNLSMFKYFFEKPINPQEDNSYLFEDTKIWFSGEKYLKEFSKYPVVSLSFKDATQLSFNDMHRKFKRIMADEYKRHNYLLEGNKLSDTDKEIFMMIQGYTNNDKIDYTDSLKRLTDFLFQHHNQKVVVIIDEYDAPLQKAVVNGFYKEAISFISSFLSAGMKTNNNISFGIMTGCTRILKESIFTGFNNPTVNSILDADYDEQFGFVQEEVNELLKYYNLEHKQAIVEEWYNGYQFGLNKIYNPWSVLNYIRSARSNPDAYPKIYWGNTSGNDLIKDLILNSDGTAKDTLNKLITGENVELILNEGIVYDDLKNQTNEQILNLFFFSGYLTQTSVKQVNDDLVYDIKIPNKEIKKIYEGIVDEWFEKQIKKIVNKDKLFEDLISGNCESIEKQIKNILVRVISFHENKEQFYHGLLAGLIGIPDGYKVKSNRETGNGRSDLIIIPDDIRDPAVIIEIKLATKSKYMQQECLNALQQIEKNKYDIELKAEGFEKIFKYGISFYKKACTVKSAEQ